GSSDEIQFVGADRFIRIYKTINAVILKIEVAGGGVEGEASRIAQAGGNLGKIRCRDIGAMVFEGEHVKGVTVQSTRGTWNVAVGEGNGGSRDAIIAVGTKLEEQVIGVGLA